MTNGGKISVITPVYNSSGFLRSYIANMERQTYRNFELIFVDDRSPDASGKIIEELAAGRGFVKCVHREENGGPGAARNTGMKLASGEYVMFIDVDDSFSDKYLETMKYVIDKDRSDIAFCSSVQRLSVRDVREDMFYSAPDGCYRMLTGETALRNLFNIFDPTVNFLGTPWAKIARRSLYESNRLEFPEYFHEDIIMTFKELSCAGSVACYNSPLYFYNRMNPVSGFSTLKDTITLHLHRVPELIGSFVKEYGMPHLTQSAALRMYFYYFRAFYQFYYTIPFFTKNYGSVVSSYHKEFVPFDFEGNEYYVFFQLFLLYLTSVRNGFPDHFAEFVQPFQNVIRGWLDGRHETVFNDGQKAFIRLFSEIRPGRSPWRGKAGLIKSYRHKVIRELYDRLTRAAAPPWLVEGLDRLIIGMSGWFDAEYFRDSNPDLAGHELSPLDYFVRRGWREGRNPNAWFDVGAFLDAYPEVRKLGTNPLTYFYLTGMYRRRFF
jgi:glycosyltransferase involved in cell wall biosynthesis